MSLLKKKILLGVTGSIAAYKSPEIVRRLRECGAEVRVMMTDNAKRFITPLTLQAVSGHSVHHDLFDLSAEAAMGHIELARFADLIVIAPASADTIAKIVTGRSHDLLSAVCLASRAPLAIVPAMNQGMWLAAATQKNIQQLKEQKVKIWGPSAGHQACGEVGFGRMLEPSEVVEQIKNHWLDSLLLNCRVMITAGPTQEAIDPVRYLTNRSSGKMGYALAEAALERGATVTLISGPVVMNAPQGVNYIPVKTADEMHAAVMRHISQCDIFFGVAAVSDYRCKLPALQKIAKKEAEMSLAFIRNRDIIAEVSSLRDKPFIVGFAAETSDVINKAKLKKLNKKMDVIIANDVSNQQGMESDENAVTLIGDDWQAHYPLMLKRELADKIITRVAQHYLKRTHERSRNTDEHQDQSEKIC